VETVRAIRDTGIRLGVVSSAVYHPFLEWALQKFGFNASFEAVSTSAATGYYKSRPEIFLETVARLRSCPTGSVHVGDSARYDVESAARAGMKTVWLNSANGQPPSVDPDLTLETLEGAAERIIALVHGGDR
jgi:FMN phosphatase YigB (HAD superfamily)